MAPYEMLSLGRKNLQDWATLKVTREDLRREIQVEQVVVERTVGSENACVVALHKQEDVVQKLSAFLPQHLGPLC